MNLLGAAVDIMGQRLVSAFDLGVLGDNSAHKYDGVLITDTALELVDSHGNNLAYVQISS
jgi:hypothetical protein